MNWIYTKDFPQAIKDYCEHKQISYRQLSRDLGVGKSSIHDWIEGRSFPRAELYEKVVLFLLEDNRNETNL